MSKKRAQIGAATIIICIILSGVFYSYISTKETHRISVLDAKKIADKKAIEFYENPRAYSAVGIGKYSNSGECEGWMFKYRSDRSDSNNSKSLVIKVWWNGNTESYEDDFGTVDSFITNWTVDSTEAVKIAKSVGDVSDFLSTFKNVLIERIAVVGEMNRTDGCMINIQWVDGGIIDDPHSIRIWIDGTDGEVINVESYSGKSPSYSICFIPVVIIISILLVALLSGSNRHPNLFIAGGFTLFLIPSLFLRIYYSTLIFTVMTIIFAVVLWLGTKRGVRSNGLNDGKDRKLAYSLFGVLAADYFGLLIARFLLIPYFYPLLLWSSLLIINAGALYIILSTDSEEDGRRMRLKSFRR